MKKLDLMISLEGLKFQQENSKTPQELMMDVITDVIFAYGSQKPTRGLDERERRQYYKIADKFDEAKKGGAESIELEDDWFGFIRKCFRETSYNPITLYRRVEEKIEAVSDR